MTATAPPVTSSRDTARTALLALTVQHAVARSAYYRERIGDRAVDSLSDLHTLPLLTKADLVTHRDALRTIHRFPDALMYTSGTTGRPLEVPVYREEIEANERLIIEPLRARLGHPFPLTVTLLRVGHGTHVLTPTVPSLPCHISYGVDQLIDLLGREHWIGGDEYVRPSVLEANLLNARYITGELLHRGIDPATFGLSALSLSGWYLPRAEREALAGIWKAEVVDRYGVTEVNGDAKWCAVCRAYHFDFAAIPEVLEVRTDDPIPSGVGRLIITGLYPFNQAVPKIRYDIGDLVEIRPATCGTTEPAIAFLGRLRDVLLDGAGAVQLTPSDVAEALALYPDVARKQHTGFLRFLLTKDAGAPLVKVELNYEPSLYPARQDQLQSEIVTTLRHRRPDLEEVRCEFRRPGSLDVTTKV